MKIGIDAAGIAITRRHTAVVSHQDLLRRVSLADQSPDQSLRSLAAMIDAERFAGKSIVFTNGVFDILHAGHIQILQRAKALGDVLIVGVNSDASTRRLKGRARPIDHEVDRLALVSALESVDFAILFDDDNPAELSFAPSVPTSTLRRRRLPGQLRKRRQLAKSKPGLKNQLSLVDGRSTTGVINRIVALAGDGLIGTAP